MGTAKSKKNAPEQPARMTIGDKALATRELREWQAKVKASGQLVVPEEALDGLETDWVKAGQEKALATKELREAREKIELLTPGEALDGLEADWAKLGADMTAVSVFERGPNELRRMETPDDYIAAEYPWLEKSQDVPRLLKALLREVVAGRLNG